MSAAINPASADLLSVLQAAERFIAGFEGDTSQEGIDDLLGAIRRQAAALASGQVRTITACQKWAGSKAYSDAHTDWGHTAAGYWYRMRTQRPNCWKHEPLRYFVKLSRYDAAGRLWSCAMPAVMDDFGDLVEVPA